MTVSTLDERRMQRAVDQAIWMARRIEELQPHHAVSGDGIAGLAAALLQTNDQTFFAAKLVDSIDKGTDYIAARLR